MPAADLPSPRHDDRTAPAERRHAPRVLCVGDAAWFGTLRSALAAAAPGAAAQRVPGYLHALGELATHGADVVLGRVRELRRAGPATAAALRELAPAARLVLLASPPDEADARQAVRDGFDEALPDPPSAALLSRALRAATPTLRRDGPAAAPAASAKPPPSDADLGDVDLLDQVLQDPARLRGMALRVLASRGALGGIAWAEAPDTVPAGHARAAVAYREHRFGVLHAPPPATPAQLAPWAAWLGHWLALAGKVQELSAAAFRDELTGLWNRRYFHQFLAAVLQRAARERFRVTVLLFDIDDFKTYNDRYGHAAGDDILREAARLMQSVVRAHDVVARIGGDEFAVIFWDAEEPRQPNSQHPQDVFRAAERFRRAIAAHRFPKLLDQAPGKLTISGGLAGFPWDGRTPEELLELADQRALQSKRQGKNALTFGPGTEAEGGNGG